jgi:hypothetical protein
MGADPVDDGARAGVSVRKENAELTAACSRMSDCAARCEAAMLGDKPKNKPCAAETGVPVSSFSFCFAPASSLCTVA